MVAFKSDKNFITIFEKENLTFDLIKWMRVHPFFKSFLLESFLYDQLKAWKNVR